MKKTELAQIDLIELEAKEAQEINGGWWPLFVAMVLIQALTNPQAHINELVQGFQQGYNATK